MGVRGLVPFNGSAPRTRPCRPKSMYYNEPPMRCSLFVGVYNGDRSIGIANRRKGFTPSMEAALPPPSMAVRLAPALPLVGAPCARRIFAQRGLVQTPLYIFPYQCRILGPIAPSFLGALCSRCLLCRRPSALFRSFRLSLSGRLEGCAGRSFSDCRRGAGSP